MKNLSEKATIKFNWYELFNLRNAIKTEIKDCIKLDKAIGVKFPYYESDKDILKLYKKVIKQMKKY